MGALVTLRLPDDSPLHELPWIITFGPLGDEEDWEPVVSGPYERPHALALAQSVVADEELMAVVEPCMPHISTDEIRGEIEAARIAAFRDERPADGSLDDLDLEEAEDVPEAFGENDAGYAAPPPTPDQVMAGWGRIAAKLTAPRSDNP
ncbi:hypothetical protein O7635_12980 [Asanoa sp. WMMD1127]|uniref:hypothetical protein n=1 Tax=Asanoa sp. WMMD1127 TaxID=3016107 RepID=UPI002416745B|nr:hypothetical protein [Asanoa sp. WMMD1127]MDG4822764.1 hypothetical protein [Asanoa sp. WMMD1127]